MKKLLLFTLAACLTFSMAYAQLPHPELYRIAYGNADGSPMAVGIDKDINVPCWGHTDPADMRDTVATMHNPLKSANSIIPTRTGGFFPTGPNPIYVGGWDLHFITNAVPNSPDSTNQGILGIADLGSGTFNPINAFWFGDDAFHLVGTFMMHTANDPGFIGQTICPFAEGKDPANGGLLWGFADGLTQVIPIATYSCLYFSPNACPVWTVYPTSPVNGNDANPMSFPLAGTDADLDNPLTITQTSGPGAYTPLVVGPGGNASGFWSWAAPAAGDYVVNFVISDGICDVPLEVLLHVTSSGSLVIGCESGYPGADIELPVKMFNGGFSVGGFDILIDYDPTVLDLLGIDFTMRDDMGREYNNVNMGAEGPGTVRVVYIADVNNGVFHAPIAIFGGGDATIFYLHFHVGNGVLFGTHVDVNFLVNDFRDNTISDSSGYIFFHPPLTNGCVDIVNPREFKGDPNMNCLFYEIADVVLVAQRLIYGYEVWSDDDLMPNSDNCNRHFIGNDPLQEASADLNGNGFVDVADLVRFINIINGYIMPPKLDPTAGDAEVYLNGNSVMINSGLEVGAVLVKFNGQIGTPIANNGMSVLSQNGSVLVYSLAGNRISAGSHELFTINGNATIAEVSVSDAYGRLMNVSKVAPIPTSYAVAQNYPNPFNAKTEIKFDLPTAGDVTINIYNVTGQLVQTISNRYEAGYQSVTWDATNVASGIYFYKLTAGDFTQTMKMTLLK